MTELSSLRRTCRRMRSVSSGQGLIEYLVLLCLVAVTTIGIVSVVGQNIKQQYEKASYAIRGEDPGKVKFETPTEEETKRRGMNDWEKGAKRNQ